MATKFVVGGYLLGAFSYGLYHKYTVPVGCMIDYSATYPEKYTRSFFDKDRVVRRCNTQYVTDVMLFPWSIYKELTQKPESDNE